MDRSSRAVAPVLPLEFKGAHETKSAADSHGIPRERFVSTPSPRDCLAERIDRVVRSCTSGKVRGLKVEVGDDGIRLIGYCLTFYSKQLAQHAAMALSAGLPVTNDIAVE